MSQIFSPGHFLGAALVGLIGAAGMFLIEQIYNNKRRVILAQDLAHLDHQVACMRNELEHLKELQSQCVQRKKNGQAVKRLHRRQAIKSSGVVKDAIDGKSCTSDTDYTEYNSALGTDYDVSSEEFYEMSTDSENEGSRRGSSTNETKKISREVEILSASDAFISNGTDGDVNQAFGMLKDLKSELRLSADGAKDELLAEVLWRMGKCCQRMANVCEKNCDSIGKKEIVLEGILLCKEAVEKAPENAEAHKWFAILTGLRSEFVGMKDKILDGVVFREHVLEALRINPTDASLYHLIGRFKFELSNLSWLERKLAATLFAEVPMSTYDEALQEFGKAEELSQNQWKENRLLLAKCHIGKGDYSTGVEWLERVVSVPCKTSDDHVAEREAQELLLKYASYKSSS